MLYPLFFEPIFKERVWGGRNLERLYGKQLPADVPIGESWEITDRPEGISVIANGPLKGRDLRWLMENHAEELLGSARSHDGRFPLLVKILDAQQKLSVQVHPPADVANELGGEPKSEMWHVTDAAPDADIFVGLKNGVTRERFEQRIGDGTVAECLHRIETKPGDSIYLPSGRLHAIGAGNVIFEIQQNSDTTYRVFDWNRVGLDGQPRELHVEQSLRSINFEDFEPGLASEPGSQIGAMRSLTTNEHFIVSQHVIGDSGGEVTTVPCEAGLAILCVVSGELNILHGGSSLHLSAGQFAMIPASLGGVDFSSDRSTSFLRAVCV
jgi:mannose-6-phosphate isomerase